MVESRRTHGSAYLESALIHAFLFSAIGPSVGTAVFLIITGINSGNPTLVLNVFSSAASVMVLFWAYVIGVPPAAITGCIMGLVRPRMGSWIGFCIMALAIGWIATIGSFVIYQGITGYHFFPLDQSYHFAGVIAAVVCAAISRIAVSAVRDR